MNSFFVGRANTSRLISILLSWTIALEYDRQENPTICIRTFHPRIFTQNIISVWIDISVDSWQLTVDSWQLAVGS
ncbi:hypothetical protein [Tychonema sp. LEGE 07203]|uniref:hypothetical protein n=1 Tax=Tychonema sp. LEGE 07203 TaxID=1828671 RepID=UPI00187EAC3B|nr:hypothetical protein [Tychonema sp. LEGE 07203]MBE9092546.1 hypothetical protein [Tychonema sp. LEGE 07203]